MTVKEVWNSVQGCESPISKIKTNLERVQAGLKLWSRNSFGNITKQLAIVQKNLKEVEAKAVHSKGS